MRISSLSKNIILVVFLASIFLLLNYTGYSKKIKNIFYFISVSIQGVFWKAGGGVSEFFGTIIEIKNLKNENEDLRKKIQELSFQIAQLEELKRENEVLRESLGIGLEKEFSLILSKIVSKEASGDFILIEKGKKDRVTKGMAVITPEKALVGKIEEVYDDFSRVILLSNKEICFDAKIPQRDAAGLIKGKGNSQLSISLLPREKEISVGDIVVTAALGGIFPEGLLVGEINEVERSDVQSFQQAEIGPAFDITKVQELFIITKSR